MVGLSNLCDLMFNFTKQLFQYDLLTQINEGHFTPERFRDTFYILSTFNVIKRKQKIPSFLGMTSCELVYKRKCLGEKLAVCI